MRVYVVFGDHTEIAANYLSTDFEIAGYDRTLDAAVAAAEGMRNNTPDAFLVLGSALTTGMTEGSINYGKALLENLKRIRLVCPKSSIKLILSEQASENLVRGILALGIYDIYRTNRLTIDDLPDMIKTEKNIADYIDCIELIKTENDTQKDIVEIINNDKDDKSNSFKLKKSVEDEEKKEFFNIENNMEEQTWTGKKRAVFRKRAGKPAALLCVGDARIDEWIKNNFSDQMEVLYSSVEPEEIRQKIEHLCPDICILMRQAAIGGIPDAGQLAEWAVNHVPVILFIVGELDDEGKRLADRAKNAGIRNIITCERGGQIYGDELVFVLTTALREINNTTPDQEEGGSSDKEEGSSLNPLLYGVEILGKAIRQSAGVVSGKAKNGLTKKITKPRINKKEGLSLDEGAKKLVINNNLTNPTAIMPGGVLAVVSPWRPNLAGRLAAQAVRILSEVEGSKVAYMGASKNSTGAMWLDVPDEVLMMSDWRVPGSDYPILQDNLIIYSVDPIKNLSPDCEIDLWSLLKEVRKTSTYTVMDFAGDISLAEKAFHLGRSVLLVIVPGNDPVELKISSHWLKNIIDEKKNVVTGIDVRGVAASIPEGLKPKVIISPTFGKKD